MILCFGCRRDIPDNATHLNVELTLYTADQPLPLIPGALTLCEDCMSQPLRLVWNVGEDQREWLEPLGEDELNV